MSNKTDIFGVEPISLGGGTATLGGDVTGPSATNTVTKLQGRPLSSTAPAVGDAVRWNGTSWVPQNSWMTQIGMTGDYLIGQPVPITAIAGAYIREYVSKDGYRWVTFNCSWDGTNWNKDNNSAEATLQELDYLGNINTYTQVATGINSWDNFSWATVSIRDPIGVTTASGEITASLGLECQYPNPGYMGGHVNFPKSFPYIPTNFVYTIHSSSGLTSGTPSVSTSRSNPYGLNWYIGCVAGVDNWIFASVKVS